MDYQFVVIAGAAVAGAGAAVADVAVADVASFESDSHVGFAAHDCISASAGAGFVGTVATDTDASYASYVPTAAAAGIAVGVAAGTAETAPHDLSVATRFGCVLTAAGAYLCSLAGKLCSAEAAATAVAGLYLPVSAASGLVVDSQAQSASGGCAAAAQTFYYTGRLQFF